MRGVRAGGQTLETHLPGAHVPIATTLAIAKLARSNKVIEALLLGSSIIDRATNNVAARVDVGVKLYFFDVTDE